MTALLATGEQVTGIAKWLVDAGGWTACVVLVVAAGWAVFIKRKFVLSDELANEKAERAKEAAAAEKRLTDERAIWEKRMTDERAACIQDQNLWRERYEELKAESISRLGTLREEKNYWRAIALKAADVAEVATSRVTPGPGE